MQVAREASRVARVDDGTPVVVSARRRLRATGIVLALALVVPASAGAAPFDRGFTVTAQKGTVVTDVNVSRAAAGDTPDVEIYDGTGVVTLGVQQPPSGELRWNGTRGGIITVPAALRFRWSETASPGDAAGTKRRCVGRTAKPVARRVVHVVRIQRQGAQVRVDWSIPQPRLGKAGCAGAGPLPQVVASDVYPAATFDHRVVRLGVQGSRGVVHHLSGRRTRTVHTTWDFTITLTRS
jgi:hypothetical protein